MDVDTLLEPWDPLAKEKIPMDVWSIIMQMSDAETRKSIALTCREMMALHQRVNVPRMVFNFSSLETMSEKSIARIQSLFQRSESIHLAEQGDDNLNELALTGLMQQSAHEWKAFRCQFFSIDTSEGIPSSIKSFVMPKLCDLQMFLGSNTVSILQKLTNVSGRPIEYVPRLRVYPNGDSSLAEKLPDCKELFILGELAPNRQFLKGYFSCKRKTERLTFNVSHVIERNESIEANLKGIRSFQCNSQMTFRDYIPMLSNVRELHLQDCNMLDTELQQVPPVQLLNVSGNGGLENANMLGLDVWTSLEDFSMLGNSKIFVISSLQRLVCSNGLRRLAFDLNQENVGLFEQVLQKESLQNIELHLESFAFATVTAQRGLLHFFANMRCFQVIVIRLSHTLKLNVSFSESLASILQSKSSQLYIL